eukprot:9446204-Pyramimonas_sp.AAC.1
MEDRERWGKCFCQLTCQTKPHKTINDPECESGSLGETKFSSRSSGYGFFLCLMTAGTTRPPQPQRWATPLR